VAAYINLGSALDDSGDVEGAIASYNAAIILDPQLEVGQTSFYWWFQVFGFTMQVAHYNLGVVLDHKHDYAGSIASYKRAIAINPEHAGSHINLGVVSDLTGDTIGAIASYERALAIDPYDCITYVNLGE
jgi:tetratricopeptide (TPR) repeat protein